LPDIGFQWSPSSSVAYTPNRVPTTARCEPNCPLSGGVIMIARFSPALSVSSSVPSILTQLSFVGS
jgi:hypothetical protein